MLPPRSSYETNTWHNVNIQGIISGTFSPQLAQNCQKMNARSAEDYMQIQKVRQPQQQLPVNCPTLITKQNLLIGSIPNSKMFGSGA